VTDKTVQLNFRTDRYVDTGINVDTWNAMPPGARQDVARDAWEIQSAKPDAVVMRVATDGAEGI
jgi:hypothetical protein